MRPGMLKYLFGLVLMWITFRANGQELEPRSLTNVPVGTNFILGGYGHSWGNVLLDPTVPVEGLNARMNTFIGAYVRSINIFGLSGKIDVLLPYGSSDWTGEYLGTDTSTSRLGLGDPSVRISVNFLGSPALRPNEYATYYQKTIVGASVRVKAPFGQYDPDKLLNLGSNRCTIILKAGVSTRIPKWIFEAYASAWFFTENSDYYGGNVLRQKPFYTAALHIIRILPQNMWLAVDGGYGIGARGIVNGEEREYNMSTFRFGVTYAISILNNHTLKLTSFSARRFEYGPDFNSVVLSYNFRWNSKVK